MKYFSDTERGALPRTNNEIPYNAWCGVTAYIQKLIDTGYFGEQFPELCPDGQGCCGTDEKGFSLALKAEIEGGKDFAEVAQEHSNCPSKAQGGDLGSFGPGQMVAEFDKVVFSAPLNEVQGPVQTQFGYHLLEVTARS